MDVEDLHPLRARAKRYHILTICQSCLKKKNEKPDFVPALRRSMLDELGIKIPESEEQLAQDPFLMLGYGVNAYFDIMFSLVIMYACITVFCLPVFHAYAANGSEGMRHYSAEGF